MNKGINLLHLNNKTASKTLLNRLKLLRMIATTSLFIVSVSSVILFLSIALSPLPKLKQQELAAKNTLAYYNEQIIKMKLLQDRVQSINSILSKRTLYDKQIELIQSKIPHELNLESLTIEKNKVSVTVSSNSLSVIDTFMSNLKHATEESNDFSRIIINNFSRKDNNKGYLLTVNMTTYE